MDSKLLKPLRYLVCLLVISFHTYGQEKEKKFAVYGGANVSFFSALSTEATINNAANAGHYNFGISFKTFSLEYTSLRSEFQYLQVLSNQDETEVSIEQVNLTAIMNEFRFGRAYSLTDIVSLGYGITAGFSGNDDLYYRFLPGISDSTIFGKYYNAGVDIRTRFKIYRGLYGLVDLGVKNTIFWSDNFRHSVTLFKTHIGLIYRYEF